MRDQTGRDVDTLRIAVTGKNSFPALYSVDFSAQEKEALSAAEIEAVVKAAASLGVKRIKLVGGEPMEREDIVSVVEKIAAVEGIEDVSMNTNALYLKDKAVDLKNAGLNRVNILLDTFFEEKYIYITGGGKIDEAMDGMEAAVNAGLHPVRINAVIMKGFNDDEIFNFGQVALNEPIDIKFIERNPGFGKKGKNAKGKALEHMPIDEIKNKFKGLIGLQNQTASGLYYIWGEARGKIGFVSPETASRPEISGKLELTCDGILKTDILGADGQDISESIKTGDVDQIRKAMEAAAC